METQTETVKPTLERKCEQFKRLPKQVLESARDAMVRAIERGYSQRPSQLAMSLTAAELTLGNYRQTYFFGDPESCKD